MKKSMVFLVSFFMLGVKVFSQTWTIDRDKDWNLEYTVITQEQFNRIIAAQETTALFVFLEFRDTVQRPPVRVIQGSWPNFNGFYYLSLRDIPKTDIARDEYNNFRAVVRYRNARTGHMDITFLTSMIPGAISLRFNWNEYIRQKNLLIRLVNGE
jgi:hypothetical protein